VYGNQLFASAMCRKWLSLCPSSHSKKNIIAKSRLTFWTMVRRNGGAWRLFQEAISLRDKTAGINAKYGARHWGAKAANGIRLLR
jgi:hypothetical protein